jgi:chromosome segregation ATPase
MTALETMPTASPVELQQAEVALATAAAEAEAARRRYSAIYANGPHDQLGAAVAVMEQTDFRARACEDRLAVLRDQCATEADARSDLGQTIEAATAAREGAEEARAAHDRVVEQLSSAEEVLQAAIGAVEQARTADARVAKQGRTGTALRAARATQADAEDQLNAVRAALEEVAADLEQAEADAKAAEAKVVVAADAVLVSTAYDVIAQTEDAFAKLAALRGVLRLLGHAVVGHSPRGRAIASALAATRDAGDVQAVPAAWEEARRALRADARAPLPRI